MTDKKSPFPVMERMTVKHMRSYLARKQSVIVPLGVIEQHGYHLPLNTDALIASKISRMVGERTDILVAPVIYTSFSGGGLPGTINISPAVMSLVVSDTILSLVSQGFKNIYLILCHGGSENAVALNNAVQLLLRSNPACSDVMIALLPVWLFNSGGIGWHKALRSGDWHAGWLETSMMMALDPDSVRMEEMELDPEPILNMQIEHPDNYQHAEKIVDDEMVIPRMSQRPDILVGVMGHPELASAELGRQIVEDAVSNYAAKIAELESKADGVYKEVAFIPPALILTDE